MVASAICDAIRSNRGSLRAPTIVESARRSPHCARRHGASTCRTAATASAAATSALRAGVGSGRSAPPARRWTRRSVPAVLRSQIAPTTARSVKPVSIDGADRIVRARGVRVSTWARSLAVRPPTRPARWATGVSPAAASPARRSVRQLRARVPRAASGAVRPSRARKQAPISRIDRSRGVAERTSRAPQAFVATTETERSRCCCARRGIERPHPGRATLRR